MKARIWAFKKEASPVVGGAKSDVGKPSAARAGAFGHAASGEALLLMRNFEESRHGWFWSTDSEGRLTYLSDSVASSLGVDVARLVGSRFAEIFVQADDDLTGRRTLPFILAKQTPFEKVTLRAATGVERHFWSASGCPQFDGSGQFTGYRGRAIDVTDQRRSSEHASQLAKYDSLTGLPNRRRMCEMLDASLVGSASHKRSCAVLLIDLDRFKQVNDTLGHPAGDALLKQVAERLGRIVGDNEKVFRLGGDEFQVTLPDLHDRGIIGKLAADIIASVSQPYSVEGSRCVIGASVGVAVAPEDGTSRDGLIRNADLALYAAKSGGRGRFRFFSTELLQVAEDKRALEDELRDALALEEISIAYQPIVNTVTNCMTGVEALIRWCHPTRGWISPAIFIPIAEETGLIGQLGDWVLHKACQDAAGWPGSLRVAVNVSPIQFTNESLPSVVQSALAASGLAPDRLELEITEGVFLGDSPATDTMFAALKELGVRLSLDDFGTGYSSLGYLRTAPFDKIKIDQTFVRAATLPESRNGAIIAAIVALAEALDMETTAEGIEYMDQLDLMKRLRVSHIQGWIYSKAVSSEELTGRLQSGDWVIKPSGPARQRSDRQAMYRKVGLIFANRYESVVLRNLSASGALIEGPANLSLGALIVVDFGDGQLTFARVSRLSGRQIGIAFEQELVDDGDGGLCTSQRVSPYLLRSAGLPSPGEPDRGLSGCGDGPSLQEFVAKLGLALPQERLQKAGLKSLQWSCDLPGAQNIVPTFRELSERYLETVSGDPEARESAKHDLRTHILPQFGQLRLDQVNSTDLAAWLTAKVDVEGHAPGTDSRLHALFARMWTLAVQLNLPGSDCNPTEGSFRYDRRGSSEQIMTSDDARRLLEAARASQNRQLKYILSLLMLTGARPGELLKARWEHIDLAEGVWRIEMPGLEGGREMRLNAASAEVIAALPRWEGCAFLLANPITKRPYQSVSRSWEVARSLARLPYLEIDDLRYCDLGAKVWEEGLLEIIREPAQDREGLKAADRQSEAVRPANAEHIVAQCAA
jgi:diguanylate cyclase (GGDEF)-like protein